MVSEPVRKNWEILTRYWSQGMRKAKIHMLITWRCLDHYRGIKELSSYQLREEKSNSKSFPSWLVIIFVLRWFHPPRPSLPLCTEAQSPFQCTVIFQRQDERSSMADCLHWQAMLCAFTPVSHLAEASLPPLQPHDLSLILLATRNACKNTQRRI